MTGIANDDITVVIRALREKQAELIGMAADQIRKSDKPLSPSWAAQLGADLSNITNGVDALIDLKLNQRVDPSEDEGSQDVREMSDEDLKRMSAGLTHEELREVARQLDHEAIERAKTTSGE